MIRGVRFGAVCLLVISPVSASAQYFVANAIGAAIGNMAADARETACLKGEVPATGKIDEIRAPLLTMMGNYVNRAAGTAPVDMSSLYTGKTKMREWQHNGSAGLVNAVDDPFARDLHASGRPLASPDMVIRSGDERAAVAVWHLSADRHYRTLFRREAGDWKLQKLELIEGPAEAAGATQFCHKPGDVEQFKIDLAKYEAEQARKKAEKEARRRAQN